jgi:Kef-type K+ transport system membrane component KefB
MHESSFNPYVITIFVSGIVILSFLLNRFSRMTKVPSAVLLILSGILMKLGFDYYEVSMGGRIFEALELLGLVGLVMIVLEAALDLKLTKEKRPVIFKSLIVALVSLLACTFGIAFILNYWLIDSFFQSLFYAIPLSIMSSAIIIPSVGSMAEDKREFLIYESTFSDILGIMLFFFVVGYADTSHVGTIVLGVTSNIVITIIAAIVVSYAMVLLLQTLKEKVKLFFLISMLLLLYSVGKLLHMSSLLIIMVFGLILNNYALFFKGKLKELINATSLNHVLEDFHVVTLESAFVIRTFFFVIFGLTLDLSTLYDLNTALIGVGITLFIFASRYIFLKMVGFKNVLPTLLIAPRGLITVLLFFSIPATQIVPDFNPGVLLYIIILTNVALSAGLMLRTEEAPDVEALYFPDMEALDSELAALKNS